MKKFNVMMLKYDRMEPYDVIPSFVRWWEELEKPIKDESQLRDWLKCRASYMYWSKCEWEMILSDWPCEKNRQKIDVYEQIMMNFDLFVEVFKDCVKN